MLWKHRFSRGRGRFEMAVILRSLVRCSAQLIVLFETPLCDIGLGGWKHSSSSGASYLVSSGRPALHFYNGLVHVPKRNAVLLHVSTLWNASSDSGDASIRPRLRLAPNANRNICPRWLVVVKESTCTDTFGYV